MIKTVIEKIILNNFGKFINGIQKDKLSVDLFGGNFKLENISLNHQYFDSLNTPFKLAYSSIGKLNLTASLSKLSSVPVQCVLDNIYVIFEFRPQVSEQDRQEVLQNQKQSIKKYIDQMFKNYLQKIKEEKKEDGMITKLGKKIIDNLQMKIINVHVRFEESRGIKYAWGLTLQEITLVTANDKWQPTFIDRDKETSFNEKLYKKMNVKNLSLYWETPKNQLQAKQMLINLYPDNNDKRLRLLSMIQDNNHNSIISITSQFKLIMNNELDEKVPLYQLDISLQPIKFELDRIQVAQMIDFIQKNVVQNQMILRTIKHKKKDKLNSQQETLQLKQQFKDYVQVIIQCQQNSIKISDLQIFESEKKHILQKIFKYIQMEELIEVSMLPIKKIIKKIREEQLKKRKRGWFGSTDTQLDENQLEELQRFVQTSFKQDQQKKRSQSSLFFRVNSSIAGGNFKFVDRKSNPLQDQLIQFQIGQINLSISKSSDPSFMQIQFSVEQIALGLILPQIVGHKYTKSRLQIFKNQRRINSSADLVQTVHQKFISLVYKKQSFLPKNQETVPKVVTTVFIQMERIIFIYKKIYFKKFKQFFTFKNLNQYMKSTTIQKLESLKQKQKVIIEQKVYLPNIQNVFSIEISVISPKIVCPFNQRQSWCLSLGDLKVTSKNDQQKSVYPMKITSAYLKYYSDIQTCLKSSSPQNQISSSNSQPYNQYGAFSVINDMNFDIVYESNKLTKSSSTQIQLPQFQLNFSRAQYQNLLTIKNIFTLDIDEKQTIIQHLKKSRLEVQELKIYEGPLNVKNQDLGTWKPFHSILAGDFIYLYENKKQLKQTLKISVNNCSTCILSSEGMSSLKNSIKQLDKQYQLQLISSQQYCHFSCETLQQIQKWEQQITKKANQFKTISQLMQFYEDSDNKSESSCKHSRMRSAADLTLRNLKKNLLQIKIAKIGFKYQDFQKEQLPGQLCQQQKLVTLMNFQIHQAKICKIQQQDISTFTVQLSQIKISDQIFRYKDQKFQTFLSMKDFALKTQKSKARQVPGQQYSFSKKQKSSKKNYITVQDLIVNWKPDVILIVLDLMNKHFSVEQKYRMEDQTQTTRKDHFDEIQYDAKYMFGVNQYSRKSKNKFIKHNRHTLSRVNKFVKELMTIDIKIVHTQAFFIHRQSHLVMFRLQSNLILTQYVLGQHEKFISGSLGTITLEQMNSYPQKKYNHEDPVESFCFVKKKQVSGIVEQKPVISFNYSVYEPSVFPNQQRVDSFLYVQIQPIELIYFQQVIFRLIDYSLIQIMLLINQPEMVTANQNLMQQIKKKEEIKQKPVKMLFSKYQQIIKKLMNPFFMDMYFQFKDPQFILKAQKNSEHFYKMNLDSIKVENRTIKTQRRFSNCQFKEANKYIYEEQYSIKFNHLVFEAVDLDKDGSESKYTFFDPVELDLVFNKLQLQDELNLIYPELGSKPELEYDRSFITNSKMSDIIIGSCSRFEYLSINKLVNFNFTFDDQCDQSFIHNFKVTKLLLPKPIIYTLEVNRIVMNADYKTQGNQQIKLFKADIRDFRYQYLRMKDFNSQMNIKFGDTNIIGYRYNSSELKKDPQIHEEHLIHFKSKQTLFSTQIVINGKTTGQKIIQMTTKSMKMNLQTGLLQLIFEYTLVQDWIFPIISKTVPEMTFYATIQDLDAVLQDDPALLYELKLKNKIIQQTALHKQLKFSQNVRLLKLCGVLCYKFRRKKTFSNLYFKEMLQKNQMSIDDIDKLPQQTCQNIAVNTELYHCYKNTQEKRKIMDKFTLNMNEIRNLRVSKTGGYSFKNSINRTFNLDKCFFKVSVIDLLLMKDFLQIMQIQREYINFLNKTIGKNYEQDEFPKNVAEQLNTLDSMNLNVSSLSFYLINSWKKVFIPIINFKIEGLNITSRDTFKKDIIQGDLSMMLNYFNPFIFKWEPALERVNLSFFKQTNKIQNNKKFAGIESTSTLILNISKQMFVSMKQTIAAWNTQSYIFNNRFKSDSASNDEPIQFISHYIIRNQTGYPLQIFCQNQLKYQLDNFEQVDHQMQLQDFQQEMQRDVIIELNIIHPKHQFKRIGNVSVNAQKEYIIKPRLLDGSTLDGQSKISIRPIKQNSKQVLVVGSTKKVKQYFDNQCVTSILAFDSPAQIKINKSLFGQRTANLYTMKQTKTYKFIGQNGTLTIMPKYLVFNYTPIPLKINQKVVKPNQYTGVFDKPTINGQKIRDSILRVQHNQKEGHFYIFCEAYIVDYVGLYFDFGSSDEGHLVKNLYAAQGQKNKYKYFIYVLPQSEFKFKVKIDEKAKQHQTLKTAIGQLAFQLRKGTGLCNFSAFCYLNPYKNQHLKEFNRVIQITPTYVLSNTTKDTLKICQKDSLTSMSLKPQERCPFFWESVDKPKQIKISAFSGNQMWGYSGSLQISKSCQTVVLRKNSEPTQYRIFSIHVERTNTITFVHIFQAASKYKIANQIKGTLMTVFQSCLSQIQAQNEFMSPYQSVFNVRYGEEKDFGYQLPLENHALTIQVELDPNMPFFKDKYAQPIVIQDIQSSLYVKKIILYNQKTKQREGYLTLVLQFQGNVKKLKLVEQEKQINNELDYEYSIKIISFGISLIGMHDDFRRQIIFCLFQGVDLQLTGNGDFQAYELVIQGLRIQNQLKHNVSFPTILQSYKTKQANFFIQFILNRDAKNSKFIRSIGLAINRTIITVTSQELQALQENLTQIFSIKINAQKQKQKLMVREYELFKKEALNVEQSYYFQQAQIQPLKLILTFKHVNNWGGRLLKTFSSMNQSRISVDGKRMMHFNAQNIGSFMRSVQQSYKQHIFKNILPLIGNLSILGSPVSLVQKIGSGFKDLIQLPAEQFQNGPLGIGKGIAKGTRSLVKNTFQGAMNTVESFTGSIGNGLTALVDDKQFQKKRQKIKNQRTQHVGEGLKYGAKSIFNGFSKGITGLVTQPVIGAQKGGLPGFLIGSFKGITGLVIKPVSGIIDATTKTVQGIKNTANFLSPSQRQKRLRRVHKPRPFYSHCREFRSYDPYLAQITQFLQKYGKIKVPLGWVGCFNLRPSEDKTPLMLLTYEYLIFLDLKQKKIVCQYHSQDLVEASKQSHQKFRLSIRDRKTNYKQGHINLQTEGSNARIVAEINKLVKFYRPKFTFE